MDNNSPPSGNTAQIIIGLLALGAAIAAFGSVITDNPKYILLLLIIYGVCAAVLALITGVWDRISDRLSNDIARVFLRRMDRGTRNKFRATYLKYLYYSHRTFDIKGLSTQGIYALELEQIFVDLSIAPDAKLPESPIPSELSTGGHSIWEYLAAPTSSKLAILGAPGGGKTTLLKHVALTLAADKKSRPEDLPDYLPILLFLREHVEAIVADPKLRLVEAISASLELMDEQPPQGWFEEYLDAGKCLIMLDGLDEVASTEHRHKVVAWVDLQMKVYGDCPFILTSRPHGYRSNPLSGVLHLVVRPFNREQVERFVNNWYLANEIASYQKLDAGVEMAAKKGARDVLKRIYDAHDIAELAVNPLLLTMIATLHKYRSSLPGRRVELYAEICEVLLGRKDQASGLAVELTPAQKISVLQPLAFTLMERKTREIDLEAAAEVIAAPLKLVTSELRPVEFLDLIRNRSGILVEREQGSYAFSHKTFQEYLSATHIQVEKMQGVLIAHIDDPWWAETIRLYCARADATPIVESCLRETPPTLDRLILAIECEYEALKLDPEVREHLRQIIEEGLDAEDVDTQHIAAEALLRLRLKRLARLDDTVYADTSETAVTNAEYQLFLDDTSSKAAAPDHWMSSHFQPGSGKYPVVGVSPEQAVGFCQWLTDHSTDIEVAYRLPVANEVSVDGSYWVQTGAAELKHYTLSGKQNESHPWRDWILAQDTTLAVLSCGVSDLFTLPGYAPHTTVDTYALQVTHVHMQNLEAIFRRISNRADELDRDLGLDIDRAMRGALDRVRDAPYVRIRALASDLSQALVRMINRKQFDKSIRDCADVVTRDLTPNSAIALATALDRENAANPSDEMRLLAEIARLISGYSELGQIYAGLTNGNVVAALTHFGSLDAFRRELIQHIEAHYADGLKRSSQAKRSDREGQARNEDAFEDMRRGYASLALLERRRTGQWQPYELLRFVREVKLEGPQREA